MSITAMPTVLGPAESARPAGDGAVAGPSTGSHRGLVRPILTVAAVLTIGYLAIGSAPEIAEAITVVPDVDPAALILAAVFEAASFIVLGLLLYRLIDDPAVLDRRNGIRVGLVACGLGGVLPLSPAPGLALASTQMRRRSIPTRRTTLTLGLTQWYTTRALFGLFAVDAIAVLTIVEINHPRTPAALLALGAAGVAALVALMATARLITRPRTAEHVVVALGRLRFWRPRATTDELRADGARWHSELLDIVGPTHRRLTLAATGMLACLADALCFWLALTAAGIHVGPLYFLLVYTAGTVASLVPFLPGGIGALEVIAPAMLSHAHVPITAALVGVLTYRVVATVLPAIAGAGALAQLRQSAVARVHRGVEAIASPL